MAIAFRVLGIAAAVYLTVNFVPGITVSGGWTTLALVTLVWTIITMFVKPVLSILALPITLLTFGLFSLVLNALLFWGMELVVPGFDVAGFMPALFGSIVLSLCGWAVEKLL